MIAPIRMILFCPSCGAQHVDAPDPANGWHDPPHLSHLCAVCGHIWRPADVPTSGVAEIGRKGSRDAIPIRGHTPLALEAARLRGLLNAPELRDFAYGAVLEAAHQRERFSVDHDAGKGPEDWFWLVGYLAGKALRSAIAGDLDKALHHCISTAAALANWHAALLGADNRMRPGIAPPDGEGGA